VLQTIITRLMKLLTRRGVLAEDMGPPWLEEPCAEGEEARTLQAAAVTYRTACDPRAGHRAITRSGGRQHEAAPRRSPGAPASKASSSMPRWAAKHTTVSGWNSCAATLPGRRCRTQRVHLNAAGPVELKLKTTWRDGTTLLVMSPLESTQQLAALVPRPVAKNSPANDCFAAVNRGTRMPAVGRLPPTILHRSTAVSARLQTLTECQPSAPSMAGKRPSSACK